MFGSIETLLQPPQTPKEQRVTHLRNAANQIRTMMEAARILGQDGLHKALGSAFYEIMQALKLEQDA